MVNLGRREEKMIMQGSQGFQLKHLLSFFISLAECCLSQFYMPKIFHQNFMKSRSPGGFLREYAENEGSEDQKERGTDPRKDKCQITSRFNAASAEDISL